jgi:hypothetical protein
MIEFLVAMMLSNPCYAQKKLNTNLYESEASGNKSFSGKVRVVRDISDDVEVFFETDKAQGAYTLPRNSEHYAQMLKDLETSKKPGGPAVSVTADEEKRIKSVQINKGAEKNLDPNKTWDFGPLKE